MALPIADPIPFASALTFKMNVDSLFIMFAACAGAARENTDGTRQQRAGELGQEHSDNVKEEQLGGVLPMSKAQVGVVGVGVAEGAREFTQGESVPSEVAAA
jgi:hypothetical protein